MKTTIRLVLVALALLLCTSCADQTTPAPSSSAIPSPTIASQAIQVAPAPRPAAVATQPSAPSAAGAGQPTAASQPSAEASVYLWPTYLPAGMTVSPPESRVAGANELGAAGLGFYVMTLNGNNQKLSIGGGDIKDTLPISGDEKHITAGARSGKLITSGTQREIVFDVSRGKLFVYSSGLSEDELLKVADSLQPIDVQTLRGMVSKP